MANIQPEHGTFKFANEMADALCRFRIPAEMRSVFDAIIRKTWGWRKREDRIAISTLSEMTGLSGPGVCRALRRLKENEMIVRDAKGLTRVQKDWERWKLSPHFAHLAQMPLALQPTTSGSTATSTSGSTATLKRQVKTLSKERLRLPSAGDNPKARALGMKADEAGSSLVKSHVEGPVDDPLGTGQRLAAALLGANKT